MSNTVQAQHPAVVLRSSYQYLRALLAIATVAIVGLTVAVVVLAIDNTGSATVSPPARAVPSAIGATPSAAVEPNPDQRGASPTSHTTSSSIRTTPSLVEPNPDQR